MAIVYRPAQAEDLTRADSLVVASVNDLTVRHGFGPMASASPPSFQLFSLDDDPDGLWVADNDGEIAGFAWSWACEDLWFLAQLFVDPARQGSGIGNELLKLTNEHAKARQSVHKALITFTFNRVSQALYMRHGLFPKMPIYFFSIERERAKSLSTESPLRATPIEFTEANVRRLGEIDRAAIGVAREKHHRYLLADPVSSGVFFHAGDECIGYGYTSANGHVGPLAVTRADALRGALAIALGIAANGSSKNVSAFLPGQCDSALSLALKMGMRITFPMLLMASPGYGDWNNYLPRNPGFM